MTKIEPMTACSASILFGNSLKVSLTKVKLLTLKKIHTHIAGQLKMKSFDIISSGAVRDRLVAITALRERNTVLFKKIIIISKEMI